MNVGREPCILYETVELLYAYINGISADRLTMDRVYCIPAPEIARLMGAACAGVDRQDPDFRRFFARRPILDEHSQFTCLAFCMVYWFIRLDTTDMTLQMDRICANWERIRRQPFTIRAINRYALDVEALPEAPVIVAFSKPFSITPAFRYFRIRFNVVLSFTCSLSI